MLTTPKEFAERFDQMLDALRARKDRVAFTVKSDALYAGRRYADGVDLMAHDLVEEVEAKLGLSLPPAVRAFYEFTPSMNFEWKDRESGKIGGTLDMNIDYLIDSRKWPCRLDALEWEFKGFGIDVPRAKDVLLPFDFYSNDPGFLVDCAAFLLPSFDVVVSEDGFAGFQDTCLLTFEEYMDLMFRTFCSPSAKVSFSDHRFNDKGRARHVFPELFERPFSLDQESVIGLPRSVVNSFFFRGRVNPFLGSDRPTERAIDSALVRELASAGPTLSHDELRRIGDQHQSFLEAGGGWGTWTVVEAAGVPLCTYSKHDQKPGAQACLRMKNIAKADLRDAKLPYADLSAAYGVGADLSGAVLENSVLVDSIFEGANFTGASLRYADLSGCQLAGACFFGADLQGADFEGADCTDVDFRGANLEGSSFIGAKVSGAKTQGPPLELIEQTPVQLLPRVIATLRARQMGIPEIEAIAAREGVREVLESHLRGSRRVKAPEVHDNHEFYHLLAYLRACQREGVGPDPELTPKIAEFAEAYEPTWYGDSYETFHAKMLEYFDVLPPLPPELAVAGKSVAVAGELATPRSELEDRLRAAGATVVDTVTRDTYLLVSGERGGSNLGKARVFRVQVLSEATLLEGLREKRLVPKVLRS